MSGRVIHLARRETAAAERDRLTVLLTAIETTRTLEPARAALEVGQPSEEEWDKLEECIASEEALRACVLAPELTAFLTCIRDELAGIAEPRS